jgi:dTDP-4-amino-4,6-dideoxygalactose transaminase
MSELAIAGGNPVRDKPFPTWPVWDEKELETITEVLRSGGWSIFRGVKVRELEKRFAAYQGARYVEACVNGTAALEVALRAAGVGQGDEVIVPALTWLTTATSVLFVNATPVFVDIDPDTYCIDPEQVEAAVTEHTKAVIPVHLYSRLADMDRIMDIARKDSLVVIEDCAHAHGSQWRGKGVGSIGDMGCFSFEATKTMTSGEGGLIVTNNRELSELSHSYINSGRLRKGDQFGHRVLGRNYRLSEFQAAILLAQLSRLDEQTERRQENARYLDEELGKIEGIRPLKQDSRVTRQGFYAYVVKYSAEGFQGASRDQFLAALYEEGIPISPVYEPVPRCILFPGAAYPNLSLPVTTRASYVEAVNLPQFVLLGTREDMDDIIEAVWKMQKNADKLKGLDLKKYRNTVVRGPDFYLMPPKE